MSDQDEEVPDLTPEAKAFLARHQATGEPSAEGLERGRQRVVSLAWGARPVRRPRRTFLPPEVMAAAAVVAIVLGLQVLYLVFRTRPVEETPVAMNTDPALKAISDAWRAGDFEGASRLASKDCHGASCGQLTSDLAKALQLTRRMDSLSPAELDDLAGLDATLSGGQGSGLQALLTERRRKEMGDAAAAAAAALFKQGVEEKKAKNFEQAVILLERCIRVAPGYHPCYRILGSVYASIAKRDQSAYDMEKARKYYERFLGMAPPDDEYVPRVTAILEAAKAPSPALDDVVSVPVAVPLGGSTELTLSQDIARVAVGDPSVVDISVVGPRKLRLEGRSEGKTTLLAWYTGGGLWTGLLETTAADDAPTGEGARRHAQELYLRAYQLRESDPPAAIELFKQVMVLTSPDDEYSRKAKARLAELQHE